MILDIFIVYKGERKLQSAAESSKDKNTIKDFLIPEYYEIHHIIQF